jgi:hypothetical protein
MNGWAGGGISRISARSAALILLKKQHFNKALAARLTGYAAKFTRRIDYKPAKVSSGFSS